MAPGGIVPENLRGDSLWGKILFTVPDRVPAKRHARHREDGVVSKGKVQHGWFPR